MNEGWVISVARTLTHMKSVEIGRHCGLGRGCSGQGEVGGGWGEDEDMLGLFSRPSATILCMCEQCIYRKCELSK